MIRKSFFSFSDYFYLLMSPIPCKLRLNCNLHKKAKVAKNTHSGFITFYQSTLGDANCFNLMLKTCNGHLEQGSHQYRVEHIDIFGEIVDDVNIKHC